MTATMNDPASATVTQLNRQTDQVRDHLRIQSEAFWSFQDRLLEHMERMSRAWFLRRHEGTHWPLQADRSQPRREYRFAAIQRWLAKALTFGPSRR